jgi:DNA-binding NarL/FixJ family response regulator
MVWCRLSVGENLDVALVNLVMPGRPLVVLADDPEDAVVVRAIELGAAGCCNSRAAPEVLQQVALVVGHGGLWVGQSLLQRLVSSTARILGQRPEKPKNEDWASKLSEREREVAERVAKGASNKEIAEQMGITERTVKAHLTAIFEKLRLRDRLQLSLKINGI